MTRDEMISVSLLYCTVKFVYKHLNSHLVNFRAGGFFLWIHNKCAFFDRQRRYSRQHDFYHWFLGKFWNPTVIVNVLAVAYTSDLSPKRCSFWRPEQHGFCLDNMCTTRIWLPDLSKAPLPCMYRHPRRNDSVYRVYVIACFVCVTKIHTFKIINSSKTLGNRVKKLMEEKKRMKKQIMVRSKTQVLHADYRIQNVTIHIVFYWLAMSNHWWCRTE